MQQASASIRIGYSLVYRMYNNIVDKYGYTVLKFYSEREDLEGKIEAKAKKYYMAYGKIYNNRYKTDTHARFIRNRSLEAQMGLEDYPTYTSLDASDEELHEQASLHIQAMDKLNNEDK